MASGNTILAVDDNQTVTRFIASILKPLGYQVDSAQDGVEALARLSRGPVDLILLDLVMPRMNGYHFCKALEQKKLSPDAAIILLSSADERVAERMQRVTQIRDFLPKPVKAQQLREVVAKYLPQTSEQVAAAGEQSEVVDAISSKWDSSDEAVSNENDLGAVLRDRLHNAVAEGLAARLDDIVAAEGRESILGILAEITDQAIGEDLVSKIIAAVQERHREGY